MSKITSLIIIALVLCLFLSGCSGNLINGDTLSVTPHQESSESESTTDNLLYANSYDELYDVVISMAKNHVTSGVIRVNSYTGNLSDDFENICQQITHRDPFGSYAIYYISNTITRIVSYYEINVTITYSKNLVRIQSLGHATSSRYFNSGITDAVKNCESFYAVYTSLNVTQDDVRQYVKDLYYGNPLEIPALPEIEVSVYPDEIQEDQERIVEVSFTYPSYTPALESSISRLGLQVQELTEKSSGSNDGEILLSLCRVLCDAITYTNEDDGDSLFGTACNTLDKGRGNGEGYAMVYKALCDKLGLECRVVLGSLNDVPHAWNIVSINGEYYHVDVSMCDEYGEESSFLLRDDDMLGEYRWDTEGQPKCAGSLTYSDIIRPPEAEYVPSVPSDEVSETDPSQETESTSEETDTQSETEEEPVLDDNTNSETDANNSSEASQEDNPGSTTEQNNSESNPTE